MAMLAAIANAFITRNPASRIKPEPCPRSRNPISETFPAVIATEISASPPHPNASASEMS